MAVPSGHMRYNKGVTKPSPFDALTVRILPVDHPDAQTLSDAQQRELGSIFGFDDLNRLDPVPFTHPGGAFVVVYDGDDLVACGGVSALSALPGHAEIKRMYTVPDRRRQGVSRWLVTVLEDHARILGYSRIGLETGSTMTWAISLYTGMGYLPIPTYPPYIGNGYSICFAKDL